MTQETIKPESVKEVLTVSEITAEQLYELNKDYNPRVWKEKIDNLLGSKDCKFYHAKPQRGYEYDRFYAVYQVPEGIRFFNQVSYSSSLTSNGFCQITIDIATGIVRRHLLKDGSGKEGHCANDKANRAIMARNSRLDTGRPKCGVYEVEEGEAIARAKQAHEHSAVVKEEGLDVRRYNAMAIEVEQAW